LEKKNTFPVHLLCMCVMNYQSYSHAPIVSENNLNAS